MIKKIILTLFLLFSFNAFCEEAIQAGIKYNEANARVEAFKDVQKRISKDFYKQYLTDPNKKENINSINNKIFFIQDDNSNIEENKTRELCPFYLKNSLISYGIIYQNNLTYSFYYDIFGRLMKFDVINSDTYPRKTFAYSRFGNLISVIFEVNEDEQFVYNDNGKLIAHWIGNEMKNKDNSIPRFLKLKRGE